MDYSLDLGRIEQFGSLEFLAKQVVEGFIVGLHKSPYHGFSVEFAEHRLYNPGESTRHIDWKLYGRTDRMYVKKYEEETNLRCQIIIDNSSSMYFPVINNPSPDNPNKITFSIYAAASIMNLLRKQRDAVGVSVFSGNVELNTRARSSSVHHKYLYSELEKMLRPISPDVKRQTFATEALHEIAEKIHKRSLVVLFSDMFDSQNDMTELFAALQHLKYNKHEVILFHVTEKHKEIEFDYDNRPYRFIDMESNREVKLNPQQVREIYRKNMSGFTRELEMKCLQHRIDFIEADINRGFDQVLMAYLIKRQKMF